MYGVLCFFCKPLGLLRALTCATRSPGYDLQSWINPGKEPQIVKAHPIAGRGDKSAVTMEVWAGVGFHVIEFRAKDAAGNTDSNPTAFEWVTF